MKMNHDYWKITACLQFKDGELLDKNRPFSTYCVEAPTASRAIEQLKKDFPCCTVTVYGEPIHDVVSVEEYENGK